MMKSLSNLTQVGLSHDGSSNQMSRSGLLRGMGLAVALAALCTPVSAQFTLNCPPNMVVGTGAACDAAVNYAAPYLTGGAVGDTIYAYTGSPQIFVVPAGATTIDIECWGAQGNSNALSVLGGLGGNAIGTLAVTPGETLYVEVGGGGIVSTSGGYNGGGAAGAAGCPTAFGGGGGGASDVRQGGTTLANRVIVAGGGGGAAGNRISTCGRGTGGGGGGGYYGGGGGAAWPSASLVVPTGGDQVTGGIGGTSTYTSAPGNNGAPGALGIGGAGGIEVTSNQGGNNTASSGAVGGGTSGGNGTYAGNFTGQSGAGGSGYIAGLTGASMTNGVRSGNGQVRITALVAFSLVQSSGLVSGDTFPLGITSNTFMATQGLDSSSCTFTVEVQDQTPPTVNCPSIDTVGLDSNCAHILADYGAQLGVTDNCSPSVSFVQSPAAGTPLSGIGALHSVSLISTDPSNNSDTCAFQVYTQDFTAPTVICPSTFVFHPSTLDCDSQFVNFPLPVFSDNCAVVVEGTHAPGALFPVGTTMVSFSATDSSNNLVTCTFAVEVSFPVIDGIIAGAPVCDGDPFDLNAAVGFANYLWSTGATTSSITSTSPGTFWVDVTDANGCTGRDSFDYAYPALPAPQLLAGGNQICTGSFATYQWFQNGSLIPGATGQCYQPTSNGNFSVLVTDSLGCSAMSDSGFVVSVDAFINPGFELYPNPARDQVQVRLILPLAGKGSLRLYDLSGSLVREMEVADLGAVFSFDLRGLASGSYLVELKTLDASAAGFKGMRRLVLIP